MADNLIYRDVYGSTGIVNTTTGEFEAYESQDDADSVSNGPAEEKAAVSKKKVVVPADTTKDN